jgi:hypothetical protein
MIKIKEKRGNKKRAKKLVPDPTSTYEKHTPERVSPNVKTFF